MNYCYPKYTHFSLWGSQTLDSHRIFLQLSNYYEIDYFLCDSSISENEEWESTPYCSIETYLEKYRNRSAKILITLRRNEHWKENVEYLLSKGLKFFDDFNIFFLLNDEALDISTLASINSNTDWLKDVVKKFANGRELFFINGNCQTTLLQQYLLANKNFNSSYYCIALPRICQVNKDNEFLFEVAINISDLCITQPVSINNKFSPKLSTEAIRQGIKNSARIITIPKLHFAGYFPQLAKVQFNAVALGKQPVFAYGDKYLNEFLSKGEHFETIKDKILDKKFLSPDFVLNYFYEQLKIFIKDEKDCDIKMYDYIEKNARKEILWHSFNHPTNVVIKELAKRILNRFEFDSADISFEDEVVLDENDGLRGQMQLIYPSVYFALGVPMENKLYTLNVNSSSIRVASEDYIRIYCNSYRREAPVIDIWGSCVSRELFNFTNRIKTGAYILQNPIHTMWEKPVPIDEEKIQGTSNFTKRMAHLEFYKKAEEYFNKNFNAKYLMIDTCDCRNDVYVVKLPDGQETLICESLSAEKTLNGLSNEVSYIRKSVFDLPDKYWDECLEKFVDLIKRKYKEENIIINRFKFADRYIDEKGVAVTFKHRDLYLRRGQLTQRIEKKLEQLLPKALILSPINNPLGNAQHKIGLSPMHYIDEYYYIQNMKLENLLGLESFKNFEIDDIENRFLNLNN